MRTRRDVSIANLGKARDAIRRKSDADRAAAAARRAEDPAAVLARRDRFRSMPVEAVPAREVAVPVHGRDACAWLWGESARVADARGSPGRPDPLTAATHRAQADSDRSHE